MPAGLFRSPPLRLLPTTSPCAFLPSSSPRATEAACITPPPTRAADDQKWPAARIEKFFMQKRKFGIGIKNLHDHERQRHVPLPGAASRASGGVGFPCPWSRAKRCDCPAGTGATGASQRFYALGAGRGNPLEAWMLPVSWFV